MRVIGGSARGRPLVAPKSPGVRPTSDRVREAIFDVLGSLGAVLDAAVVDLFAGSGALGLEAASRGARAVTFVESDRLAAKTIETNLERTGLKDVCATRLVVADALAHLELSAEHYDLALIDPPYVFEDWTRLLSQLRADVVVCESRRPVEIPPELELYRDYRYGTTLVTVAISPKRATSGTT